MEWLKIYKVGRIYSRVVMASFPNLLVGFVMLNTVVTKHFLSALFISGCCFLLYVTTTVVLYYIIVFLEVKVTKLASRYHLEE